MDIDQRVTFCADEDAKIEQLKEIIGKTPGERVLVFCEMKRSAETLSQCLHRYQIAAIRIHGDMEQRDRKMALDNFRTGRTPVLVATDVAARGLDVKGISVVVNFDPAGTAKDYVHRIGRTGRAGHKGVAYSLLLPNQERKAREIVQVMERNQKDIPAELQRFTTQRRTAGKGKGRKGGKGFGKGKGKGFGKGGGFRGPGGGKGGAGFGGGGFGGGGGGGDFGAPNGFGAGFGGGGSKGGGGAGFQGGKGGGAGAPNGGMGGGGGKGGGPQFSGGGQAAPAPPPPVVVAPTSGP